MTDSLPYRRNVGAAVFNRAGQVFVGRRGDAPPGATHVWQMPQGGIDADEDPEIAVLRELREETGITSVQLLGSHPEWLTYDLPPELIGRVLGGKYRGQSQRWFALRFTGDDSEIDLAAHDAPEFVAWRWVDIGALPDLAVPFKRGIYEAVVREFAGFARKE